MRNVLTQLIINLFFDSIYGVNSDFSLFNFAAVAELVDAHDSKSCEIYLLSVQFRPAAPHYENRRKRF